MVPSPPAAASPGRLRQRDAGPFDAAHRFLQDLVAGRVGDAEMRREAKRVAVHHRDPLGGEQVFDKILVAADYLALWGLLAEQPGAGRIDVKRSLWPRTMEAGDLVQRADHEIAPF